MKLKQFLLLIVILFLTSHKSSAQDITPITTDSYNVNENSISILLNTNGYGLNYRYAKWQDGYTKRIIDADFVYIKHPKEIKITMDRNYNGRYVYGKLNTVFSLRAGYGKQKELFSKYGKGSLSIKYFYTIGPGLGILKPMYFEVLYSGNKVRTEKYDNKQHGAGTIIGKAAFLEGFDEIKIKPSVLVKVGSSFEYSQNSEFIRALEIGATAEIFSSTIPIMATEENNQVFITLFVSYRFGKTVSTRLKSIDSE